MKNVEDEKVWNARMSNEMAREHEEEFALRELNTREHNFDREHLCKCAVKCKTCKCADELTLDEMCKDSL